VGRKNLEEQLFKKSQKCEALEIENVHIKKLACFLHWALKKLTQSQPSSNENEHSLKEICLPLLNKNFPELVESLLIKKNNNDLIKFISKIYTDLGHCIDNNNEKKNCFESEENTSSSNVINTELTEQDKSYCSIGNYNRVTINNIDINLNINNRVNNESNIKRKYIWHEANAHEVLKPLLKNPSRNLPSSDSKGSFISTIQHSSKPFSRAKQAKSSKNRKAIQRNSESLNSEILFDPLKSSSPFNPCDSFSCDDPLALLYNDSLCSYFTCPALPCFSPSCLKETSCSNPSCLVTDVFAPESLYCQFLSRNLSNNNCSQDHNLFNIFEGQDSTLNFNFYKNVCDLSNKSKNP
jgi:hypothetical protein